MSPRTDQALLAAHRFLGAHRGEHLAADRNLLIDRCTAHLSERFDMAKRSACDIALQAYGESCGMPGQGFVEIDRSTSTEVWIRDLVSQTSCRVTIDELLALVRRNGGS